MTKTLATREEILGYDLPAGARHYRAFVGPPATYDIMAAAQFMVAIGLGLRDQHTLCDIGCGSLRAGRLFIPYLLPDGYYGIEPEEWLLNEGLKYEVGEDLVRIKRPRFAHGTDYPIDTFGVKFDLMIAQSIFSHAAEPGINLCLAKVAGVLKPGGVFACTFMEGEHDYVGDEQWVYPGCVTFRFETMVEFGARHGLTCERVDAVHPNGQSWIGYQLANPATAVDTATPTPYRAPVE